MSKKSLSILLPYVAMMASLENDPFVQSKGHNNGDNKAGIPDNPNRVIPKGLKKFKINGEWYFAINYKNAFKKAKKNNINII